MQKYQGGEYFFKGLYNFWIIKKVGLDSLLNREKKFKILPTIVLRIWTFQR